MLFFKLAAPTMFLGARAIFRLSNFMVVLALNRSIFLADFWTQYNHTLDQKFAI